MEIFYRGPPVDWIGNHGDEQHLEPLLLTWINFNTSMDK